METADTSERTKRRHRERLGLLKQRAAILSTLGFAAFLGLTAQHAVGSSKHRETAATPTPSERVTPTYFDQQADGFAFDDAAPAAAPAPPAVAQTRVS